MSTETIWSLNQPFADPKTLLRKTLIFNNDRTIKQWGDPFIPGTAHDRRYLTHSWLSLQQQRWRHTGRRQPHRLSRERTQSLMITWTDKTIACVCVRA